MKLLKKIAKSTLLILALPLSYLIIALILSITTVNRNQQTGDNIIYLTTNGVHLGIVLPIVHIENSLISDLYIETSDQYLSFGWGDKNFYLNTPTWGDLTIKNAFSAVFLKSATLLHVTRYQAAHSKWIAVNVSEEALKQLNYYIANTFALNKNGLKIMLEGKGYTKWDNFYQAKGSYSLFKTCNTWVNTGFKQSGLKACFWTPFDFGLLRKYR
ncbi:MAG: DUF2459 domain-containing protein [Crocinitomicaceae bacterium]|nr:DUF2459 domain-containing protein [Crocinitomicaceae bacterium]